MRRTLAFCALAAGIAASPVWGQPADGAAIYAKYCSQCHGDTGDGVGIATPYLKPAPRDFTSGKYKIRRTPTGSLPLDEDLERVVRVGLPYTAMPGFGTVLNDAQIAAVVTHIKSFSPDFADPELEPEAIQVPEPPAYTEQSAELGKAVYEETGCARCHGNIGFGDGPSAPTLKDDWDVHIRPADLSMPWTFRGGGTRKDIFRTMSAGFNGTPMPGFHGSIEVEKIWAIVDYIASLSGNTVEEPYGTMIKAVGRDEAIDLAQGAALFENAPKTTFPVVGQIVEKGRNFHPSAVAISAQAIYNQDEVAIRLTWHDMRAETSGHNAPDLQVEEGDDHDRFLPKQARGGGEAAAEEGDVWGDAAADDSSSGATWS
ncbi:MAG: c-type cytochrome, partial [Thermoanaerobaculia bacterium]|nr:c-type cytochrome [Thermoanaerobaculia bacterium]